MESNIVSDFDLKSIAEGISSQVFDVNQRNFYNSDAKFQWSLNLNWLHEIAYKIDSHGISKWNELYFLLNLLINWIDKSRPFHTAPLEIDEANKKWWSAYWTSWWTSYRDWMFILASIPWWSISINWIRTVLINPLCIPEIDWYDECRYQLDSVNKLKEILSTKFPSIDFVLYTEANDYYVFLPEILEVELSENPKEYIPYQYRWLPSELLEEMWTRIVYINPWKTKLEDMKRKRAITALKHEENWQSMSDMFWIQSAEAELLKRQL